MELLRLSSALGGRKIYNVDIFGDESECRDDYLEQTGHLANRASQTFKFDTCEPYELAKFAIYGDPHHDT